MSSVDLTEEVYHWGKQEELTQAMRDCPKMSDKLTQALRNQSNGLFNADTMLCNLWRAQRTSALGVKYYVALVYFFVST